MIEIEACLVCEGRDFRTLYPSNYGLGVEEAHRFFLTHRERALRGRVLQCRACGFQFTSPQFSPEEYDRIYSDVQMPPEAGPDPALRVRFEALARRLRQYASTGRLLDFGCGGGGFLDLADGFERVGFEVSSDAPSWDGRIFRGRFAEARGQQPAFADASFDVVAAWDVLEHLPKIDDDVAALRAVLKPGAPLVFSVPNVGSLAAQLQGRHWNSYLLEHLWYFSPRSIDAFLTRRGFKRRALHAIPYPASVATLVQRLNQTLPFKTPAPGAVDKMILPLPIGLMFGVYARG